MVEPNHVQFAPFSSALDTAFWYKLSELKLKVWGLSEGPFSINGIYFNGDPNGMASRLLLDYTAFDSDGKVPPKYFHSPGLLQNTNTIEIFKNCDKKKMIDDFGHEIWSDITSGRALEKPALLTRVLLLTFADLKKYHYYYWFAFPCLVPPAPFTLAAPPQPLASGLQPQQMESLKAAYDSFQAEQAMFQGFFLVVLDKDFIQVVELRQLDKVMADGSKVMFGFADPSTLESFPGWPLRNFLMLIAHKWGPHRNSAQVLCFRDRCRDGVREISHSLLLTVDLSSAAGLTECPGCVGWEKNERQKMGPRRVDLSSSMDPAKLAESAVDLNLQLMRWRLIPELDLQGISKTRCLLLGSGTLGCNVARCLMGWGVRTITLVDNARISYSNPVRQSLFAFQDCLDGGKPKAEAAAAALKTIFPGMETSGQSLSIPMPGHSVSDSILEATKADVAKLEALVDDHDVLFLLMDSRESRWLPTLLGAAKQKIVINAALGFDTFLVMRHGIKTGKAAEAGSNSSMLRPVPGSRLGCYFCNDVVAPGNSLRDRTLDEQCTVTRPGVSMIAAATAVELLVSVLQHPCRAEAAADLRAGEDQMLREPDCALGLVPHQIRGFLSRFYNVLPACEAFDKCTACSQTVIERYQAEGFQFLLRAFNEPLYLEDLTGLTQLQNESQYMEVWDLSDDDSDSKS